MQDHNVSTASQFLAGLTATTFPWWGHFVSVVTGIDQFLLGLGGLVIVGFTIWKLILEIQVNRKKLNEEDK